MIRHIQITGILFLLLFSQLISAQKVFFEQLTVTDGLPSDYVNCIFQDSRKHLWVGTDKGACRYDGKQFIYLNTDNGLSSNFVNSFSEDSKGNIWISGFEGGLCKYDGSTVSCYSFSRDPRFRNILQVQVNNDGSVYLITGDFTLYYAKDFDSAPDKLINERCSYIHKSKDGICFAGSEDTILYVFKKNGSRVVPRKLWSAGSGLEWIVGKPVNDVVGIVRGDSLFHYRVTENGIIILKQFPFTRKLDFKEKRIFLTDGNELWVALSNGLEYYKGNEKKIFTVSNGLGGNYVSQVYEDQNGNVFIGTYGGGVKIWHQPYLEEFKVEGKVNSITASGASVYFTTNQHVYRLFNGECRLLDNLQASEFSSVYKNTNGQVFIGSYSNFWKFDSEQALINVKPSNMKAYEHSGWPGVSGFFENKAGDLFLSTYGEGIYRYGKNLKSPDTLNVQNGKLGSAMIEFLKPLREGFAGLSFNAGASLINRDGLQIISREQGLLSNSVYSIFQENENQTWLGTLNGINLYDGKKVVSSLSHNRGFAGSRAICIFRDNKKRLWVLSDKYLHLLENGFLRPIRSHPVLFDNNSINRAEFDSTSNTLYIGLNNAFLKLSMQEINYDSIVSSPVLARIEKGKRQIQFKFEVPYNSITRKQDIYYKLIGFDEEWRLLDQRSEAVYQKLPPGNYELVGRSTNADSFSSPEISLFRFEVLAPFWKRGWFMVLVLMVLLSLSFFLATHMNKKRYERRIREMQEEQKIQTERERIARELHDNVGSQLTYLINKIEDRDNLFADKNEVAKLGILARGTMKELRDTIWALDSKEIFPEELENKIRQLLQLYKDEKHEINFTWNDLNGHQKGLSSITALNLYRITQEAMNNAAKHSNASRIDVDVNLSYSKLSLNIRDNGKGFELGQKEKGYGLRNMEKRASESGGQLYINSKKGEGVSVFFEISNK